MNQERNHQEPGHQELGHQELGPRARRWDQRLGNAEPRRDLAGDADVLNVVEHAPSPEAAALILDNYRRYGTPFAIYLALRGVDKYLRDDGSGPRSTQVEDLETDFKDCYCSFFPDKQALVEDIIETFDWRAPVEQVLRDHQLLRPYLVFDYEALYDLASQRYEIVHIDDEGLYVFERRASSADQPPTTGI